MKTIRCTISDLSPDIIERLNATSLFSSVGFAQLWATLGGQDVYWVTKEGEKTLAVLPGVEFGKRPLRRFQAMPAGCYAVLVPVSDLKTDARNVALSTAQALQIEGYLKLYLTDYYSQFAHVDGFEISEEKTILVDISQPDWQPPDKKIQSEIRKAEREGVIVQRFNAGRHFDGFLSLVQQTKERHDSRTIYHEDFFRALAGLAESDDRVRWLFTEHESHPVASHIDFLLGDTVLNWQVYSDRAYSYLKPNQYMLYTVGREAALMGVRFLNLGSSPDDAGGLVTYKRKWGGREYKYQLYHLKSRLGDLL